MIQEGDRIAVGVSGGKDSLLLLYALSLYRRFCPVKFELCAMTLTMGMEPFDIAPIRELCDSLRVPYIVKETEILKIIFEERKEKNPCSLCAKMRRGALNGLLTEHGYNKIALGHHRDDAVETLLLSMFYEGRIHTFHPVTYLSKTGITQIRPMVYVPEQHVVHVAKELNLPVAKSPCPANGHTKRQEMKELLTTLSNTVPDVRKLLLSALQNEEQYGLWNKVKS